MLERPAEGGHASVAATTTTAAAPGGATAAGGKPDAAAGGKAARVRSTQNGRAAAMKAMGKGK